MSWGAQSRSKDAKTPSVGLEMSQKPEPGLWPVQPYPNDAPIHGLTDVPLRLLPQSKVNNKPG
jgi:hypothetical protein